jgi:hypothetical protein
MEGTELVFILKIIAATTFVRYNVVYKIPLYGLRNGYKGTKNPNNNRYINNTIFNVGTGISIQNGLGTVAKNNVIVNFSENAIDVQPEAIGDGQKGGQFIDYNLYYRIFNVANLGWNGIRYASAAWKRACNCDVHSMFDTPAFFINPGSNFLLKGISGAKCAGEDGKDLGAYPEECG